MENKKGILRYIDSKHIMVIQVGDDLVNISSRQLDTEEYRLILLMDKEVEYKDVDVCATGSCRHGSFMTASHPCKRECVNPTKNALVILDNIN